VRAKSPHPRETIADDDDPRPGAVDLKENERAEDD
jgi:hypothetical protein